MYRTHASPLPIVALACLLGACAASAPEQPVSSAPQQAAAPPAEPLNAREVGAIAAEAQVVVLVPSSGGEGEVVCTREHVTGTHRTREICQTREARRAERTAAQEWLRSGGRFGDVSRVPTVR